MSEHALNRQSNAQCRARPRALSAGLATLLALGCSGQSTVYEVITINGGVAASGGAGALVASGGGTVSRAGSTASSGGVSAGGIAGDAAQAGSANASGGVGDTGGANTDGGVGGSGGSGVAASGGVAGNGAAGAGVAGAAGSGNAGQVGAGGALCGTWIADVPPDCHATIACGAGTPVVDQSNAPTPTNSCVLGTCNSAGIPGTAPAPVGTACSAAGGGIWCDGAGKCVACLQPSDCNAGQICSASHECTSGACTDVACGGACPPCVNGKKCLLDSDCSSFACDASSLTCITPQCQDHRQDGVETDADCGGGVCPACVLGKACIVDTDCGSLACDALKLTCISSPCADHRLDGYETDIDCGGGGCPACNVGQGCLSNFDCVSGHFCNSGHVCQ